MYNIPHTLCSNSAYGVHGLFTFISWNTYVVDGHDVEALCKALYDATEVKEKPTCIIAKTYKGHGLVGK